MPDSRETLYRVRQCHLSGRWNVEREYDCINGLAAWFVVVSLDPADDEAEMGWSDGVIGTAEDRARKIAAALNASEDRSKVWLASRVRGRIEATAEAGGESITINHRLATEIVDALDPNSCLA